MNNDLYARATTPSGAVVEVAPVAGHVWRDGQSGVRFAYQSVIRITAEGDHGLPLPVQVEFVKPWSASRRDAQFVTSSSVDSRGEPSERAPDGEATLCINAGFDHTAKGSISVVVAPGTSQEEKIDFPVTVELVGDQPSCTIGEGFATGRGRGFPSGASR